LGEEREMAIYASDYGFDVGNTAEGNSTALQAALNDLKQVGGKLILSSGKYSMASGVQLVEDTQNAPNQIWIIDGQGAVLDWSQSGLTSGVLFQTGADQLSHVHENGYTIIRDLVIIGPEGDTPYVGHTTEYLPAGSSTSVTGIYLNYSLNARLSNIMIRKCWNGIVANWTWGLSAEHLFIRDCWNGIRLTSTCTHGTWAHTEIVQGDCGIVMQPNNEGDVIHAQTFFGLRLEGLWRGVHMDPLDTPSGEAQKATIRAITFIGIRIEAVYHDGFRARTSFVDDPLNDGWQRTNLVDRDTLTHLQSGQNSVMVGM
jgi:hypothetical protein